LTGLKSTFAAVSAQSGREFQEIKLSSPQLFADFRPAIDPGMVAKIGGTQHHNADFTRAHH
jgi:hypothetical protein